MMFSTKKRKARIRRVHCWAGIEPLETRMLLSASPTVQLSLTTKDAADVSGSPSGLSPAMIEQAYNLNNMVFITSGGGHTIGADGAGETIAIVDAFGDPNISSDLETFDANFGLSNDNSFGQFALTVATPQGAVSNNAGWDTEQSLDVEWAHAIAPGASILLVEAPSDSVASLVNAVVWAADQPGVAAVSMSWGDSPEFAGETAYDHDFTTPTGHQGVTFVAASGDDAEPNYPSTSPNVLAVGGTSLSVNSAGDFLVESDWPDSGGGTSPYEGTNKPDVSYDADPNTGFLVYDSIPSGGEVGWQVVGGTSAGSPQWAAIIAIVDQGRALRGAGSLDGPTQTIPDLYALSSSDFNPVFGGGLTGLGSPDGEPLISSLVGGGIVSIGTSAGVSAQLAFGQEPLNASVDSDILPTITVDVEDSQGNIVSTDDSNVTLSIASGPGTLGGTLTVAAVNGVAAFPDITLSEVGNYTLEASDGSLSSTTSTEFTITQPALEFTQQPTDGVAGMALSPTITVSIVNSAGSVISFADSTITLSILSGPSGGTLGGTLSVAAVNGVATFSGVFLSKPGVYQLTATSSGAITDRSAAIDVAAPGYIDSANMNEITGWVVDPTDPSASIDVEVAIANGPTQIFLANETRGDLQPFVGSTNHGFTYGTPMLSVGSHTVYIYAIEQSGAKVLLATETVTSQNSLFDEHYYLQTYPTVAAAVAKGEFASGYDQYLEFGQFEGFNPNPYWNESWYLAENPTVAVEVKAGIVSSGFMQYYLTGQYQGAGGLLYFNTTYYLQNNADVAAAIKAGTITSAFQHFCDYGQYEGRSPMLYFDSTVYDADNSDILPFVTGEPLESDFEHFILYGQYEGRVASNFFNQAIYLADNPDVAAAVTAGIIPDAFQQWLEYGQFEGRTAI